MRRLLGLSLLVAAVVLSGCGQRPANLNEGLSLGKQLPPAQFTTGRGERVTVEDLRGSPAVINFWATWCVPCREEIPILQAAHAAHQDAGVQFLAVTDELPTTVRPFMDKIGMTLPVWYDPGGKAGAAYMIQSIPTTFFLDSEGRIVARHVGALTREQLDRYLDQVTGEQAPPLPSPAPTVLPTPRDHDDAVGWARRPDM
jgi:cytochrome c biogenesis protein CcmG/thiol:disulfide interchange protein DsbE